MNKSEMREFFEIRSSSGNEREYALFLKKKLLDYTNEKDINIDKLNNVIAFFGDKNKPIVMIEAHFDEISAMVSGITNDGFIRFFRVGGLDRRILLSAEIRINGHLGVVCTDPPHLTQTGDADKVKDFKDLYIDMGLDAEKVNEIVKIGDRIDINYDFIELLNDRIACGALDNKVSCIAIFDVLKKLKDQFDTLNCCVAVLFSVQEEVGLRGAGAGTFSIEPTEAIVIDVGYGKQPGVADGQVLGEGVVIEKSVYYDRNMVKKLIEIAKNCEIKYQINVEAKSLGTDADKIQGVKSGVRTELLSIPIRNMHTTVEMVDIADIRATTELISEYLKAWC